jgi:hypothetical protein
VTRSCSDANATTGSWPAKPHAAFQTLLGLSTVHQPSTYREIIDELPRAA